MGAAQTAALGDRSGIRSLAPIWTSCSENCRENTKIHWWIMVNHHFPPWKWIQNMSDGIWLEDSSFVDTAAWKILHGTKWQSILVNSAWPRPCTIHKAAASKSNQAPPESWTHQATQTVMICDGFSTEPRTCRSRIPLECLQYSDAPWPGRIACLTMVYAATKRPVSLGWWNNDGFSVDTAIPGARAQCLVADPVTQTPQVDIFNGSLALAWPQKSTLPNSTQRPSRFLSCQQCQSRGHEAWSMDHRHKTPLRGKCSMTCRRDPKGPNEIKRLNQRKLSHDQLEVFIEPAAFWPVYSRDQSLIRHQAKDWFRISKDMIHSNSKYSKSRHCMPLPFIHSFVTILCTSLHHL